MNLAYEINSFLVILKIAGLAPFSINSKYQLMLILYQVFHVLIIVLVCIVALFVNNVFEESSLGTLVGSLVFLTSIVAHLVIVIQALLTRRNHQTILDMLTEIDTQFNDKLKLKVPVKEMNKKYAIKFAIMIIVLLVNDIPLSVSKCVDGYTGTYWYWLFSKIIIRLGIFQTVLYVQMVTDRLKLLNSQLLEIISSPLTRIKFIFLKEIFGNIWEVTNIINDCFGWSLLAIITNYFMIFTSHGYWLFLAIEKLLPEIIILQSLCSMIPVAFMLSILSWFCSSCKQMSEITGSLVHKLEKSTESEQHNALISEFSLQIMHEPINLSANGFFSIDFGLLGSMAAATVTYLVILIQFSFNDMNYKAPSIQNSTEN